MAFSSRFIPIVWTLCLFVQIAHFQWVVEDEGCRTPDRGVGTCIPVNDCRPMINFLTSAPKPLTPEVASFLRSYQCGYQGRQIKVCCPPYEINFNFNPTSSPPINSDQNPPDVSNHRNVGLVPRNCGYLSTDDKIINGNKTGLFEFPWMALLSYRTAQGPKFKCGGTIISDRYILTAAHCITNLKSPIIGVRVGEHDISTRVDCEVVNKKRTCAPPYQDFAIEEIIPHPSFSPTELSNDIGLLRLASRINLNAENTKPVCLPFDDMKNYNYTGRNVVVTGFGATERGSSSNELLRAAIPVTPNEECKRTYQNSAPITFRHLCAGGRNNVDTCSGDSGGPLQVVGALFGEARYVQQGITSFGPRNCGAEGNPGVYTRVAYFMDWILNTMRP